MPNTKDTDLTAVTSAATSDIVAVTINPGSSPATRKITLANFLSSLFSAAFTFAQQMTFSKPILGSPLLYSLISSSTAINNTITETAFSKTYSLTGGTLVAGDLVRVHAAGKYSTTGSPYVVLRGRIGGTTVADPICNLTTAVTDYQWSFTYDFTVRATGVSGTMQRGFNIAGGGGSTPATGALSQTFTLNTTTSQTIDVTVQWSAASSSNTITLDKLSVEILRPATSS